MSAPVRKRAIALALVASTCAAILAGQASRGASSADPQERIVFARSVGDDIDLYSVLADGTGLRRLTSTHEADYEPTVSPGGSQVAFVSYRDFKTADADLWLMNANGGNQRRLTHDVTSETTPAWSPDGTRIAFVSDRNRGRADLYVTNLRSGRLRRLTTTPREETEPTWSPDGKRIAFTRYRSPNQTASRIFVVGADGGGLRMLSSKSYEHSPAWSPDGRTIVFVRTFEIYTMRADGSNVRRLTRDPRLDEDPAWSPDGRKVAFVSDRSGANEIWTMHADGTRPQRLTHDARVYGQTAIDWYR